MKITVNQTVNGQNQEITYDMASITAGTALQILGADDAIGNGLKLTTPLMQIMTTDGETATFDARNITVKPADGIGRGYIDRYNHKEAFLRKYKTEEAQHAAEAYIEAAERIGATWTKLDIIRFCTNTYPEMYVEDALQIADTIRGRYIHKTVTVTE